jgi:hypothetical protein
MLRHQNLQLRVLGLGIAVFMGCAPIPDEGGMGIEPEPEVVLEDVLGCGEATFLEAPGTLSERGPWPVGAVNTQVNFAETEVWYPAVRGSEAGEEKHIYDIRDVLPSEEAAKISDENNPWHACECYRGLPLDTEKGPYPVMIFIHGTGGYRAQSLRQVTHWASHGYVVMAMDHPGLNLGDLLSFQMAQNLTGDITVMLDALNALEGDLAFLEGHMDLENMAMSGHSAGGTAIKGEGHRAKVLIPMAAGGTTAGDMLAYSVVLAAEDDSIIDYSGTQTDYDLSPAPKLFAGFAQAGHLLFSDICELGREGGGLVEIAMEAGVTNANLAAGLYDGCNADQLYSDRGAAMMNHLTTAVLDNILKCRSTPHDLAAIAGSYDDIIDFTSEAATE